MTIYNFYSAAGGQATTTSACLFALYNQRRTLIIDYAGDVAAVTGAAASMGLIRVSDDVDLLIDPDDNFNILRYDDIVIDWGCRPADMPNMWNDSGVQRRSMKVLVTKPCYVALRRASAMDFKPDTIVLFQDSINRALSERDVEICIGQTVSAVLHADPAVARLIDAGLISSRLSNDRHRVFARNISESVGALTQP